MLNKFKTSSKTYKYYCKYPKCIDYRMLYPKNNINYKLNIYSDFCTKHNNKYDNTKICKAKFKKVKHYIKVKQTTIQELIINSIPSVNNNINEYNQLDEIIID